jgi:YVTN family beta-propeller protein
MRARTFTTRGCVVRWISAGLTATAVVLAGVVPARAATYVYVMSSTDNQVSQFGVGSGGMLSPLTPPAVAVNHTSSGVAVSPNGRWVYVTTFDGVAQFDLGKGGLLAPMTPSAVSVPGGTIAAAPSPDGRSLYVLSLQGAILQFTVGANGALSPKNPSSVYLSIPPPFPASGLAVSPNGRSVYAVALGNPLAKSNVVFQFDVGTDGTLSPKNPPIVATGESPSEVAVSPDGQSVYVTNSASNTVSQFDVGATGKLSPNGTVGAGDAPTGLAVSPDGGSLYVTNHGDPGAGGGSVSQYDVGPDGALSPKQPFTVPAGRNPAGVAVSPDGSSVYVTDTGGQSGSGALYQFDIQEGGTLTPKSPASLSAGNNPTGLAVSPAFATALDDVLIGTPGDDVICGLGGSDTIRGLGGDDVLYGDNCPRRANPSIARRPSAAAAHAGNDLLIGGPGKDRLYGGPGKDRLHGGSGKDRLHGGSGKDRLYGGPGKDRLYGGPGKDRLYGGPGDDTIDVRGGGRDYVDCGGGRDTVRADKGDIVRACEHTRRR